MMTGTPDALLAEQAKLAIRVPPECSDPDDAVPWLQWFRQAYPDITVTGPDASHPLWTADRDGMRLASTYFLAQLRDRLSWLLAQEESRSS